MKRIIFLLATMMPLWLSAAEESAQASAVSAGVETEQATGQKVGSPASTALFNAYTAKYEVRYNGFKVGEMSQQLTRPVAGQQTLETVAYTTGLTSWLKKYRATEHSIWRQEAGLMQPLRYIYRYKGRSKEAVERLDFDWQKGEVSSLREGKLTTLEVPPGTLDKHMLQLVLRQELMRGGRPLSYLVVVRSKLRQYQFELLGEEKIQNKNFGALDCLKVRRADSTFWLARRFGYLPVKIEKNKDGGTVGTYLMEFQEG